MPENIYNEEVKFIQQILGTYLMCQVLGEQCWDSHSLSPHEAGSTELDLAESLSIFSPTYFSTKPSSLIQNT